MNIRRWLKQLFCRHSWIMPDRFIADAKDGNDDRIFKPLSSSNLDYLEDSFYGTVCKKCGKETAVTGLDLLDSMQDKEEDNEIQQDIDSIYQSNVLKKE